MERKPHARIRQSESGALLIDWLSARFGYLSAEQWRLMLAEGRIDVDGRGAGPDWILASGETVAFDPPPYKEPEVDPGYSIVADEGDYLLVDKSGNLPCHPSGRYFKHSLWYLLRESYGETRVATRLDRETSGLVLVCKSAEAASYAGKLLASDGMCKEYLVLVEGLFPLRFEARGYLVRDASSAIRMKRGYVEKRPSGEIDSEACSTDFELVGIIDRASIRGLPSPVSLLRARPHTGRTHQIRATLRSLGFPVLGDKLYGPDETCFLRYIDGSLSKEDLIRLILPNQALHCSRIAFRTDAGSVIEASSLPRWGGRIGAAFELALKPALKCLGASPA